MSNFLNLKSLCAVKNSHRQGAHTHIYI